MVHPRITCRQFAPKNRLDAVLPVQLDVLLLLPRLFTGRIGVGTWRTQAEFKDIIVTKNGRTLFKSDLQQGVSDWELHGGTCSGADYALRQTSEAENVRALITDTNWNVYTLSLEARRIGVAKVS